jgi:hypothetical protein
MEYFGTSPRKNCGEFAAQIFSRPKSQVICGEKNPESCLLPFWFLPLRLEMQDFFSPDQIKLYRKQVGALCNAGQFKKSTPYGKEPRIEISGASGIWLLRSGVNCLRPIGVK